MGRGKLVARQWCGLLPGLANRAIRLAPGLAFRGYRGLNPRLLFSQPFRVEASL